MSLQFIFGPSGSGKSYGLYRYIVDESIRRPRQNYVVLVPERSEEHTSELQSP